MSAERTPSVGARAKELSNWSKPHIEAKLGSMTMDQIARAARGLDKTALVGRSESGSIISEQGLLVGALMDQNAAEAAAQRAQASSQAA